MKEDASTRWKISLMNAPDTTDYARGAIFGLILKAQISKIESFKKTRGHKVYGWMAVNFKRQETPISLFLCGNWDKLKVKKEFETQIRRINSPPWLVFLYKTGFKLRQE